MDMIDFPDRSLRVIGRGDVMPLEIAHATIGGLTRDDRTIRRGILTHKDRGAGFRVFQPTSIIQDCFGLIKNERS
jgi:hypothetical protein